MHKFETKERAPRQEPVVALIITEAQEVNKNLENKIPLELKEAAPLFGESGVLDSIALVTLLVAVEQAVEDAFDVPVILADEKAMSQINSPYQSIGALANYVVSLLNE